LRLRRLIGALSAVVIIALLGAGCGVATLAGSIQGYVVQNAQARSLAGSDPELGITVLAAMPKGPDYVGLGGACVQAIGTDDPSEFAQTYSGYNGYFKLTGLRPGLYQVTVTHERFLDTYTVPCRVRAGETTSIGGAPLGSLHVLSIGINEYSNPAYNLDYARPDAQLIAEILGQNNRLRKQTRTLYDSQATKAGILNEMRSMGSDMIEGDTFIMFFSGHGAQFSAKEYIVPHDYNGYISTLISDEELNNAINAYIPASRKIFIFDSCNSGGMYRSLAQSLPAGFQRSTGFEIMARNIVGAGKIVICACDKDEKSYEMPDLGHGLFTRYLTWGMTHPYNADRSEDGNISTDEAFWYAEHYVRQTTEGWVEPQTPQIYRGDPGFEWYLFTYEL